MQAKISLLDIKISNFNSDDSSKWKVPERALKLFVQKHISQQAKVVFKSLTTTGSSWALTGCNGAGYAILVTTTELGKWRRWSALTLPGFQMSHGVSQAQFPWLCYPHHVKEHRADNADRIASGNPNQTLALGSVWRGVSRLLLTNCPEPVGTRRTRQCFLFTLKNSSSGALPMLNTDQQLLAFASYSLLKNRRKILQDLSWL